MAIALRAANSATSGANASSIAVTLPTGSAAGDILFIVLRLGTSGLTVTQSAGSPSWTIQFQGNDGSTHYTYAFATAVLTPGFTAPTFSWTTSTTWQYAVIGLRSTIGATLSVDAWSAVVSTSVAANTVTPNPVTAAGSGEASVILTDARASTTSSGTDTGTFTPPTGWTTPASGTAFSSQSGGNNRFAGVCYQLGVSGTVTPATESLTDTGSHAYTFVVAHVLAKEVAAAAQAAIVQSPVPAPRLRPRAVVIMPPRPAAARPSPVIRAPVIPQPRPRGRAVAIVPRSLLASPPPVVPGKPVLTLPRPYPRPRPRAVVIGPLRLLASPPPVVPGKPMLTVPVLPRPRAGRAVVVQFTPVRPAAVILRAAPLPVRIRPPGRAVVVQSIVRPVIVAPRVVIADDGDAPWHIRRRRRRT